MYLYMHCIVIFWNHAPLIDGVTVLFSCWLCSSSDAAMRMSVLVRGWLNLLFLR